MKEKWNIFDGKTRKKNSPLKNRNKTNGVFYFFNYPINCKFIVNDKSQKKTSWDEKGSLVQSEPGTILQINETGEARYTQASSYAYLAAYVQSLVMIDGRNLISVQAILGHARIEQTAAYAHLAPNDLRDAITRNPLEGGLNV